MKTASLCIALVLSFTLAAFAADPPKAQSKDPKTPSTEAPKPPPPKAYINEAEAGPDFKIQGEYFGESGDTKIGIQVIALGKEGFRAVGFGGGLPGDGADLTSKKEATGKWEGDAVKFTTNTGSTLVIDKSGQLKTFAKGLDDPRDPLAVELLRHRILGAERDRARRMDGTEAAVFPRRQHAAALPGRLRGGFPAGVRELHSRDSPLTVDEAHDPRQLGNVLVLPDSQVLG